MKTRPYNLNNYPKGFDYMKPNDAEKDNWGNDYHYNRRVNVYLSLWRYSNGC